MNTRAKTYKMAFEGLLGVVFDGRAKMRMRSLEEEGFSENAICYAISQEQEFLVRYKHDQRFWALLSNAVRKRCWTKGDPRWNALNKEQAEKKSAKQLEIQRRIASEKVMSQLNGSCVYFLQGVKGGPIKIGYSKDVEKRIKELQTGFPTKLIALALMPGSRSTEAELHRKFKAYRLEGEWFKPAPELLSYIESIRKEGGVNKMG